MPIILSLAKTEKEIWAAGPEGLFRINGHGLEAVPQPQQELACCATDGARILVGGLPHGAAFSLDAGGNWQAAWMDNVDASVLCLIADPRITETGTLLAGTAGGGILRSHNRGHSWDVCNFGLRDYTVLALAWAPSAPEDAWPRWDVVFAGTETMGLWRSTDGGRTFAPVTEGPQRVDALTSTPDGWLLSDETGLWRSIDGQTWTAVPDSKPALVLLHTEQGVWAGGENGVELVTL